MMLSEVGLAEEERVVDPQLGYPHGYAKLCRYNVSGSADGGKMLLRLPFSEGPPQRFLPYPPQVERVSNSYLFLPYSCCWMPSLEEHFEVVEWVFSVDELLGELTSHSVVMFLASSST